MAIDGSLRSISGLDSQEPRPHLFAAGLGDEGPILVDVTDGVARVASGDLPKHFNEGLAAVATNGENVVVTKDMDARPGDPATLWIDDGYSTSWAQIWDARGVIPSWLSPLMDGEENLRAVGAVRTGDRWELHAWQALEDWFPLNRGHQLYVHVKPSAQSVLTASTEVAVIVAGAVSDQPGTPGAAPQVWSIDDHQGFSDGRWTQHRMASTPDGLTDVAEWDLGWWVAGHRQLRPVVYDFDSRDGASMPVPDTRLDPDHPVVYVAGIPISQPMVLATQSVDGPTVWVREGRDWLQIPAPLGKLSAARTVGDGVYLLIDGALWFRRLPDLRG